MVVIRFQLKMFNWQEKCSCSYKPVISSLDLTPFLPYSLSRYSLLERKMMAERKPPSSKNVALYELVERIFKEANGPVSTKTLRTREDVQAVITRPGQIADVIAAFKGKKLISPTRETGTYVWTEIAKPEDLAIVDERGLRARLLDLIVASPGITPKALRSKARKLKSTPDRISQEVYSLKQQQAIHYVGQSLSTRQLFPGPAPSPADAPPVTAARNKPQAAATPQALAADNFVHDLRETITTFAHNLANYVVGIVVPEVTAELTVAITKQLNAAITQQLAQLNAAVPGAPPMAARSAAIQKKVLIIGLKPQQAGLIQQDFGQHLDLKFAGSDESLQHVKHLLDGRDAIIAMTGFISHSHDELAKGHAQYLRVSGGMTRLRSKLSELIN